MVVGICVYLHVPPKHALWSARRASAPGGSTHVARNAPACRRVSRMKEDGLFTEFTEVGGRDAPEEAPKKKKAL
eukprot:scaffold16099_cov117-Isochrysis_galbana.AAC.2